MSTTHSEKAAIASARESQKKPQTRIEALRTLLEDLQLRLAHLPESSAETTLQIPPLFDEAQNLLAELPHAAGERGLFDDLVAQLTKNRKRFVQQAGGAAALAEARTRHRPTPNQPWWFLAEAIATENRRSVRRALSGLIVAALILVALGGIYRRFLAPDPAIQASVGHQTVAENLLTQSRYAESLAEAELALALWPENQSLLTLRGVLHQRLEQPEKAAADFEAALQAAETPDAFYAERAGYFIMGGQPALALADAETAIAINPSSAIGFLRQAQAYEALGERTLAIEAYEQAAATAQETGDPQLEVIARINLGNLLQSVAPPTFAPAPQP